MKSFYRDFHYIFCVNTPYTKIEQKVQKKLEKILLESNQCLLPCQGYHSYQPSYRRVSRSHQFVYVFVTDLGIGFCHQYTYFLELVQTDLHWPRWSNWTRPAKIEGPSTRRISGIGFAGWIGSSVLVNVILLWCSPWK